MSEAANTSQEIPLLRGRRIVLGVTGSIAVYKAAALASRLTQAGAQVDTVLSGAARRFISPLTFQSLTGRQAYTDEDLWGAQSHILHVGLAHEAEVVLVAPATANTLAKMAHGIADSLLMVTLLATSCPLLVAPAMDVGMFADAATQENLRILQERGVTVIGPARGRMASGLVGPGRMVEPEELLGQVRLALAREGHLAGRTVVVTAGGTREPLDPVRVLTNRSSGKQGYAIAQAALDRGAQVVLITAPTALPTPVGAQRVDVETAEQMQAAVLEHAPHADVLFMAAAVADFRPRKMEKDKIKREHGALTLELEPTEDILAAVAAGREGWGRPAVVVGFAAESGDLVENARAKLAAKGLDLIVANDISAADAGFDVDTNRVAIVDANGVVQELPLMPKVQVAEILVERAIQLLEEYERP
jgi:phosphopantothenoylcysteine decarboxylase/phosphopantothenate--cysteine ligase